MRGDGWKMMFRQTNALPLARTTLEYLVLRPRTRSRKSARRVAHYFPMNPFPSPKTFARTALIRKEITVATNYLEVGTICGNSSGRNFHPTFHPRILLNADFDTLKSTWSSLYDDYSNLWILQIVNTVEFQCEFHHELFTKLWYFKVLLIRAKS